MPATSNRAIRSRVMSIPTSKLAISRAIRLMTRTSRRTPAGICSRAIRRSSTASPAIPSSRYAQPGVAPVSESDEKTWAIISHISIPFFGFIGPLIAYLVYKDRSEWLKQVTTEALNFSILYSIAYVVSVILTAVVIGLILWPLVFIVALIFCIMGTIAANKHEFYKYPINIRFIK